MSHTNTNRPHETGTLQDTLPLLEAGGFVASVDAYAWERNPDPSTRQMQLWFISLLGSQQAVKALWARLIKGEVATLSSTQPGTARFCALAPEGPKQWRFLTAGLPASAGYQGVLVPEAARSTGSRTDFLLLCRPGDDAAALHYRYVNQRLDLPLHPGWSIWLWERALHCGEAVPLEGYGVSAYRCRPDPAHLAADVLAAIRAHKLYVSTPA